MATAVCVRLSLRCLSPVPGPRLHRRGVRRGRPGRRPSHARRRGRRHRRVRRGRPPRQSHRAQPHAGDRVPLRRAHGSEHPPHRSVHGALDAVNPEPVLLLLPASPRWAQLCADARRGAAGSHRAPPAGQDPGRRPVPDGDRVLRLRSGRPAQPDQRLGGWRRNEGPPPPRHLDRGRLGHRPAPRLRDREPPDARHRLLGRGVRPVRPAVGLRRLRRGADGGGATLGPAPQGRDGRDLLFGLLAARGGGHGPPGPGRHHAAEPHRRPVLHRVSRWDLQRRVRRQLGGAARLGRAACTGGRPAVGGGRDRHGGHDLSGEPAPARTGPEPRIAREPRPGPDAGAVRPALAPGVGLAHHGARVPGGCGRRRRGGTAVARPHHRPRA